MRLLARTPMAAVLVTLAVALAACNDDGGSTADTTAPERDRPSSTAPEGSGGSGGPGGSGEGDQAICDTLRPLKDSNDAIADLDTFDERRDYLLDNIDDLNDAYDEAIDVTDDDELRDALETLRAYNDEFVELLEENDTEAELNDALENADTTDVEQAGITLNTFTIEQCGFTVAS